MNYRKELTDQDAEILAELYVRHVNVNKKSVRFSSPETLLSFLRRSRLKTPSLDLSLAAYLETVRTDHSLTQDDIAAAINTSVDELSDIESRSSLPWELSTMSVAQIACLYGVHIRDLERLVQNSCNMAIFSRRIKDRKTATADASQWISEIRAVLEQFGAKELIT